MFLILPKFSDRKKVWSNQNLLANYFGALLKRKVQDINYIDS